MNSIASKAMNTWTTGLFGSQNRFGRVILGLWSLLDRFRHFSIAEDRAAIQKGQSPNCFVAGTLVHTKEGLKPIEQIQVGDWALWKRGLEKGPGSD